MGQSLTGCCDGGIALPQQLPLEKDLCSFEQGAIGDLALHELSRTRLSSSLEGITADALLGQHDANCGRLPWDVLLRAWWCRAQELRGRVELEDLRTMKTAIVQYEHAYHQGRHALLDVSAFLQFAACEASEGFTIGGSSGTFDSLRGAVAMDLPGLHACLRSVCTARSLEQGMATVELVTDVLDELFRQFGDCSLSAHDVVAQMLREPHIARGETHLDVAGVLLHVLGRTPTPVELILYDISQGSFKMLSPLLFGKQFEAIYHSSVLVYGTEFWYGGHVFENAPPIDPKVFGPPLQDSFEQLEPSAYRPGLQVVRLGYTLMTMQEVHSYVRLNLKESFTFDNYDVITNNCNHFSNKLVTCLSGDRLKATQKRAPEEHEDVESSTVASSACFDDADAPSARCASQAALTDPSKADELDLFADVASADRRSRRSSQSSTEAGEAADKHCRKDCWRVAIRRLDGGRLVDAKPGAGGP